jgi:hypothetical protein
MLNKSGISKTTYGAPKQILANVELQASVGVIVDDALGTVVGTKKIAKAGTPVAVDFSNRSLPVAASRSAVNESATATVTGTGVTAASVTAATFGTKVANADGTYEFEAEVADSTTTWKLDGATVTLSDYGITPTGTAADGDKISVAYVSAKAALTANAVLLHDVDVTAGDANGTALYFGIVNYNRLDSDVQALVSCGVNVVGAVSIIKG